MLSYSHNCLVYSAILRNGKEDDIKLLQNLRSVSDPTKVIEYYQRSASLIQELSNKPNFTHEYWDEHYESYIKGIVDSLKAGNNDEAINKILAMLDSLESELGV